jgi:TetR/AcrR family transcriptional regulator, cholesterol catabolism regulator
VNEPAKRGRPRQGRAVARDLPRDEELLQIAAEVLWTRGFYGTRLDDIAAEAGISKGSLYHYFESKDEIFERLVANILGTLAGDMSSVRKGLPPSERLRRVVERWVRQAAEHPIEVGLLHKELANLHGPAGEWARAVRRDNLTQLREIIGDGQATGEFRPADTNLLAHGIMGSVSGFTEWYRPGGEITVDHLVDEVCAWIMAGIEARPQPASLAASDFTMDGEVNDAASGESVA